MRASTYIAHKILGFEFEYIIQTSLDSKRNFVGISISIVVGDRDEKKKNQTIKFVLFEPIWKSLYSCIV